MSSWFNSSSRSGSSRSGSSSSFDSNGQVSTQFNCHPAAKLYCRAPVGSHNKLPQVSEGTVQHSSPNMILLLSNFQCTAPSTLVMLVDCIASWLHVGSRPYASHTASILVRCHSTLTSAFQMFVILCLRQRMLGLYRSNHHPYLSDYMRKSALVAPSGQTQDVLHCNSQSCNMLRLPD